MAEPDWLDELTSAMESGRGAGTTERSDLDDWAEELATDLVAPAAPVDEPQHEISDVEARLARVELLIDADLDKLGPAVLAESVAALAAEIDALRARLPAAGEGAGPTPSGDGPAVDGGPAFADAVDELRQVVARIEERQLAQSRFLAAAVEGRLDTIAGQVERALAAVEGGAGPDPSRAIAILGRRIASLERALTAATEANGDTDRQLTDLLERLDRLTTGLLG